ncbi:MAG TPA: bifunctional [glutamate--ammonia ligase]-adenylyl-L-tyrosine phosphorylase/[glutamate--ammonia-ligase] adenylyltransferase, partial [Methylococcaceae bacterium]|nr:bifunctional [glutamate--ammonia ligase]-adenylyl-L-tyrosine phosphorylase/[glutamate--ammonia-ligase] adenylyltransferase [Methylococcaceae bacterium]
SIRRLSPRGATEIRRVLPDLLKEINQGPHRLETLDRLLKVLEAIASRNVYLTLLAENPGARTRLVALVGASPWFATTLGRHPILLDELLDPRSFLAPITREALETELDRKLEDLDPEDLEAYMVALRQYRQVVILRIAAADIAGSLPLPEVSNALTALAETLLRAALARSFDITRKRHGSPGNLEASDAGFAVIAYGKLGGLELGYGSDLDLVFLYSGNTEAETCGPKPVTAGEFYARLAQRILHIMGTNTPAGILYETDLRLRPSGNSGLLVSSLEAFETYQMQEAWTWEQQALVKARFVAGDPEVGERFKAIRTRSLGRLRDAKELRKEIVEMRGKMREVLEAKDPELFDLKQGAGGIVDIEFLVQFWVLAWSNAHPRLTEWTDVLRLLERLKEEHLIPEKDQDFLQEAYFKLRSEAHRAQLDERKAVVAAAAFAPLRERIQALWAAVLQPEGDSGSI